MAPADARRADEDLSVLRRQVNCQAGRPVGRRFAAIKRRRGQVPEHEPWEPVPFVDSSSITLRSERRSRRLLGPTTTAEVVLVEVDDLNLVIDVVERNRIVRPVEFVVVDRALVVAVHELARSGERIDLAGVDLLTDLLDQDPNIVALGFIERRAAVLELVHLVPDLFLAGRVEAGRGGELGRDRVENRDLIALFALDVFFEALLIATGGSARQTTSPSRATATCFGRRSRGRNRRC